MDSFEQAIEKIISLSGFENASRVKLMEDASTRSYERLYKDNQTAILMKAPPGNENPPCPKGASDEERLELGWNATSRLAASRVEAFVALSNFLSKNGFSTPRIYSANVEEGLAVIEDLGLNLYAEVLKDGNIYEEQKLYNLAGELLAKLHQIEVPDELPAPNGAWSLLDFDDLALNVNADLFVDWVPKYIGLDDYSPEILDEWEKIKGEIIGKILKHPRKLTLRDYHAENILYLKDRQGVAQIGLLDFQDSVIGFRAWDFSMLLHDARRDVSPEAHEAAIKSYVNALRINEQDLRREIDLEGAINILRIIGIFARLIKRDKKEKYRAFMPRMIGHLENVLKNPELKDLKNWIEKYAPLKELGQMNV